MKILFITHQFFPDHKTGTEVLARNTAIQMRECGHDVAFFTGLPVAEDSDVKDAFDYYLFEEMKVWRFNHRYESTFDQPNIVEQEYNNRASAAFFRTILDDFKPDVVHVFHFQRITASILAECRSFAIPVVFTPTDYWFQCPTTQLLLSDGSICSGAKPDCSNCLKHLSIMRSSSMISNLISYVPSIIFSLAMKISQFFGIDSNSPMAMAHALSLRDEYLRSNLNNIDKILIPSRVMERSLSNFLKAEHNFHRIPFYVDLPKQIIREASTRLRGGFIGTLDFHKGAHILTKSMRNISKDVPIDIFIYGDLDQFPKYLEMIKHDVLIDDRIHLMGVFPVEKINEVFSTLDLLVIPSLWHENTPLVAFAALTYGCPIIASRVDGLEELVINGKNGLFFDPGSDMELSEILNSLAKDSLKLGQLTQQAVEPAGIRDYAENLDDIYKCLLKGEF